MTKIISLEDEQQRIQNQKVIGGIGPDLFYIYDEVPRILPDSEVRENFPTIISKRKGGPVAWLRQRK